MIDARNMATILLAAGQSQRFGQDDKLLAHLAGRPLALHAGAMLAGLGLGQQIAVCRSAGGALPQALAAMGFTIVVNPDAHQGLSTSLACGIAAVAGGPAQAALLCLADMPFVTAEHIARLAGRWDATGAPVVASTNGDAAMPPAIFGRALFGQLQSASGDRGGRALLAGAELVQASACELADIDRPEDLVSVQASAGSAVAPRPIEPR